MAIQLARLGDLLEYVLNGIANLALQQGDLGQAAALLAESHDVYRERADPYGMAICLAGYGELWHVQGHMERAVRLLAQAALIPILQGGFSLAGRIEHERSVAAARAQLDGATFDTAWEAGRKLTLEQAIALAQKDIKPALPV